MTQQVPRARRFLVAFLAIACAGVLFRAQVADALVIRGDDYLYRGDPVDALERYRRALSLMPSLQVAADRYVFVSMEEHTAPALRRATDLAGSYLRSHPSDAVLLADRALCYLHLHRYVLAQRDFEKAAQVSRAPGNYVFAGWAALRAGRTPQAKALWRRALRLHAGYRPALIALMEHHE